LAADGSDETWFDRLPPRKPRQWSHYRHDRVQLGLAVVAFLAVTALVVTVLVLYPPASPAGPGLVAVEVVVNTTGPARTIAGSFWGINVGPNVPASNALAAAVAQTPARVVRFPGGAAGDAFNYTTGALTNNSGIAKPADENLSQFVAWCRTIACTPILELPGEIDDPSTAAYYVAYTESTFGIQPLAWEIGNEPALWTHFGMPWSEWTPGQNLTPSPGQYARVVHAYVAAVHQVDPTAPVLGLPGVGTGAFQETAWINATVGLNGPNISGVGIHVYPAGAGSGSSESLANFLANASGARSLAARVAADQAAIQANLPGRPDLPIYVTELGTGLTSGSFSTFLDSFPSVPFVASEIVASVLSGVASTELTQVQTPHAGSWMDENGTIYPLLALYAELFSQLGSSAVPVRLVPSVPGLCAMATSSGGSGPVELFVVNANATNAAQLNLSASGLELGAAATRWSWNSSTSGPVVVDLPSAPSSQTLPPVSVLLLKIDAPYGPTSVGTDAGRHRPLPDPPAAGAVAAVRRAT